MKKHKNLYLLIILTIFNTFKLDAATIVADNDSKDSEEFEISRSKMSALGAIGATSAVGWLMFSPKSEKIWCKLPFNSYQRYQQWEKPYKNLTALKTAKVVGKIVVSLFAGIVCYAVTDMLKQFIEHCLLASNKITKEATTGSGPVGNQNKPTEGRLPPLNELPVFENNGVLPEPEVSDVISTHSNNDNLSDNKSSSDDEEYFDALDGESLEEENTNNNNFNDSDL